MDTLGDRVEKVMKAAGVKARSFAPLVGCHYTTIYELLKNRDSVVPLRIMQERIYNVLDFMEEAVQSGLLPLKAGLTVEQKTEELTRLYEAYIADSTAQAV